MTLTLNLKPEDEAKLNAIAAREGSTPERLVGRWVHQLLFDDQLREAGVRLGNRERSMRLLECWLEEDDSDEDPTEWAEILRNIEQSGVQVGGASR